MRYNTPGMIKLSRPIKKVKREVERVTVETKKVEIKSSKLPWIALIFLILASMFVLIKYGGLI